MIQITEEQARKMLHIISQIDVDGRTVEGNISNIIDILREQGYIKKSKLDEAREFYKYVLACGEDVSLKNIDTLDIRSLHNKYEEAIEEIKNERR